MTRSTGVSDPGYNFTKPTVAGLAEPGAEELVLLQCIETERQGTGVDDPGYNLTKPTVAGLAEPGAEELVLLQCRA